VEEEVGEVGEVGGCDSGSGGGVEFEGGEGVTDAGDDEVRAVFNGGGIGTEGLGPRKGNFALAGETS
jgi:hypothetical protein